MLQIQDIVVTRMIMPRLEIKKRSPLLALLEEDDKTPTYSIGREIDQEKLDRSRTTDNGDSPPAPIVLIA